MTPTILPPEAQEAVARAINAVGCIQNFYKCPVKSNCVCREMAAALTAAAPFFAEACAKIARDACLVEPDGGSPSEDECRVADTAAERILARFK